MAVITLSEINLYTLDVIVVSSLNVSNPLRPHGLQHARILCLSHSLKLVSIELVMPSNHLIPCHCLLLLHSILPSIRVFSSESTLPILWLSIGVSASASLLPMNIQGLFPVGLTSLISSMFKGFSSVFSGTTIWKHQFSSLSNSELYYDMHWKKCIPQFRVHYNTACNYAMLGHLNGREKPQGKEGVGSKRSECRIQGRLEEDKIRFTG